MGAALWRYSCADATQLAPAGTPGAQEDKAGAKLELTTFAFRVKSKQTLDDFRSAVEQYKKVHLYVQGCCL